MDTPEEQRIPLASSEPVCVPPPGFGLIPLPSRPGDTVVFGGYNPSTGEPIWNFVPYPENPNGQVWTAGTNGPFWANQ